MTDLRNYFSGGIMETCVIKTSVIFLTVPVLFVFKDYLFFSFSFFVLLPFLRLLLRHMEVPRLGVELEL